MISVNSQGPKFRPLGLVFGRLTGFLRHVYDGVRQVTSQHHAWVWDFGLFSCWGLRVKYTRYSW